MDKGGGVKVEIQNLSKRIDGNVVLKHINLSIPLGSIFGIVGRNGSGKTTLFRTIASHYLMDEGMVSIDGQDINKEVSLKNDIFFLDPQYQPLNKMRLRTIESYFSLLYPLFDSKRFLELIEKHQLPDDQFQKYSKGMQCLLLVIIVLCSNCSYIILDEPLDGLDVIVRKQVVDLMIDAISDRERSIILASHNLNELEKLADQVAFIKENSIVSILNLSTVKMSICKLQIAFKDYELPQFIKQEAKHITHEGRVSTVIFENYSDELMERINNCEPLLIEELPLTLEDIFISKFSGHEMTDERE